MGLKYLKKGQKMNGLTPVRKARYSPSSLNQYLECPRRYYYARYTHLPTKTDYPRLCGVLVHDLIKQMERRKTKEPRRYYYKSLESLLLTWKGRWWRAVYEAKERDRLLYVDDKQAGIFFGVGHACLTTYWNQNLRPERKPIQIEKTYRYPTSVGIPLLGIFDQVRQVSLEFIVQHRPELILNGQLHPDYDPVVILDLKTNYHSYDVAAFRKDPNLYDWVREQFDLHEGIQATCYCWLYWKKTKKKPIGFVWYHLRSGQTFFTFREERDFQVLGDIILHITDNVTNLSFPKHIGDQCRRCDFYRPCREDRFFMIASPEDIPEAEEGAELVLVDSQVRIEAFKQLRLKQFVVPRVPRSVPVVFEERDDVGIITLGDRPWTKESEEVEVLN